MEPRDPLKSQPARSGGLLLSTSPRQKQYASMVQGKKSHQPFRPMKPRTRPQADLTSPSSEYRHSVACLRWQKLRPPSSVQNANFQTVLSLCVCKRRCICNVTLRPGLVLREYNAIHHTFATVLPFLGRGQWSRDGGRRGGVRPPLLEKSDDFPTNNTPGDISHAMAWRPQPFINPQPSPTQSNPAVLPSGLAP